MPAEYVDSNASPGRRMLQDSFVGRREAAMVRMAVRSVRRADAALGRVPLPAADPADEERVKQILASSRLVAWIEAALDVPSRAWQSSVLRRWTQPSIDE